jgi:hypothetical protein
MNNPYSDLPSKAFWKPSISEISLFDISELWDPKFDIKQNDSVATYGSCFAQHIGNALKKHGYKWLITENPPYGLSVANSKVFNYEVFSSRTSNIYTSSLLKQWIEWSLDIKEVPSEIWEEEGRYYDPFRPTVEPNGFSSEKELINSRKQVLNSFKKSIVDAKYFVFTLGLTESWRNSEFDYEYPMCPGTAAGVFDDKSHKFVNLSFNQILKSMNESMDLIRELNPKIKFILTVSPVPLTATYSGNHVLVATMASKSILRTVANQLCCSRSYVDYFPSYEIINSPAFKGSFFQPNQRNVHPKGVDFVMNMFFDCLHVKFGEKGKNITDPNSGTELDDEVCEEQLLEAFRK